MICIGPIYTHYGKEYHAALEVENKENCSRCLGIFSAELLHLEAIEKYKAICDDVDNSIL